MLQIDKFTCLHDIVLIGSVQYWLFYIIKGPLKDMTEKQTKKLLCIMNTDSMTPCLSILFTVTVFTLRTKTGFSITALWLMKKIFIQEVIPLTSIALQFHRHYLTCCLLNMSWLCTSAVMLHTYTATAISLYRLVNKSNNNNLISNNSYLHCPLFILSMTKIKLIITSMHQHLNERVCGL